jgi:branched-chain amino acid aminotransferase
MAAARSGCVCVDGRLLAPYEATVSAMDAGFLLGDGLFESLRASGGVPYLLDRHLERLYRAAAEMGFEEMPEREAVIERVQATLDRAALEDAYLRVTVTRGRAAGALAPASGAPTVVIAALPAPPRRAAAEGIEVALIGPPAERGAMAKSTSRQAAVLARRAVDRAGADEGIYVCEQERVLEGVSSNVFVLQGGVLLTPPVEDCLPGITRGRLLELAPECGVEAVQAPLTVKCLLSAEQAFVTNAVQGLRAIRAVDGRPVGAGGGAAAFAALAARYDADRVRYREAGELLGAGCGRR